MMMDSSRAKKVILPYDVGFWHEADELTGLDVRYEL